MLVSDSLTVVTLNTVLLSIFLQPIAKLLVTIRGIGLPPDELDFNQKRADTLYFIQFLSAIVLPVVVTVLLDENCNR